MTFTMPYGYGTTRVTEAELMTKETFNRLHPELQRRFLALAKFLASIGIDLGVGTGWRIQPTGLPGFADPGNSWHEGVPVVSKMNALAIDTVPASSWAKMEPHLASFGLRSFKNVNSEPWHIQLIEIPTGRNFATSLPPINHFNLPSEEVGYVMHAFVPRASTQEARILDTRGPYGPTHDTYKLNANTQVAVNVPGAAGMGFAIVNITITEPEASGFVTVWAYGSRPNESKINWIKGLTIANEVTIPLDSNGSFQIWARSRTHVVLDLVGYYKVL